MDSFEPIPGVDTFHACGPEMRRLTSAETRIMCGSCLVEQGA